MSLSQAFLPGTSLEPAVIPTAHASSFTLQYFPYCVWLAASPYPVCPDGSQYCLVYGQFAAYGQL